MRQGRVLLDNRNQVGKALNFFQVYDGFDGFPLTEVELEGITINKVVFLKPVCKQVLRSFGGTFVPFGSPFTYGGSKFVYQQHLAGSTPLRNCVGLSVFYEVRRWLLVWISIWIER
ncbi:MAG TPA: hypothetical protein VGR53_02980 [Nitrososphaerales archaeon]|nr:hypothetical protein [Nitrososphaerales archaeon]